MHHYRAKRSNLYGVVMGTESYQVMRRIFDEGFAAGDASVVAELCSPSLVEHQFGLAATGEQAREQVRAAIRDVHGAVPDISFTIEDLAEQGDKIWVPVRARGTETREAGPSAGPRDGAEPHRKPSGRVTHATNERAPEHSKSP